MTITIPSGRTLPLQAKAGGGFESATDAQPPAPTGGTPLERQFVVDINGVGGTPGLDVQDESGTQAGKTVFSTDAGGTTYTDEVQFNGQNVLRYSIPATFQGFGTLGGSIQHESHGVSNPIYRGDEVWTKTTMYFPSGSWQFNNGRNKFFRHRVYDASGASSSGYADLYLDGNLSASQNMLWWIYEGVQQWLKSPEIGAVTTDVWHTFECYMKIDNVPEDQGGMGRVKVWYDGVKVIDSGARAQLLQPDDYIKVSAHFLYYGNEGAPFDMHCYAKDFVVRTSTPPNTDADGFPFIGSDV